MFYTFVCHLSKKKKNETKDEYTQVNLHIQLLIVHPNNDIDIANEFLI